MARILVVDDDPWICRMLQTVLADRGHNVVTCADGKQGLEHAVASPPELVISDVMMPHMDGWTFVRALRSKKDLSLIPVIFLTALNSVEDRMRGFKLGADDYLSKPFRFEELELRVTRVLESVARLRKHASTELKRVAADDAVGFSGNLSHFGVSALLSMMELERSSGVLVLSSKVTARVFLRDGRIVSATIDRSEVAGAAAVYELLGWTKGTFRFSALDVEMEDQIKTSTTHLLMEGARRMDEEAVA